MPSRAREIEIENAVVELLSDFNIVEYPMSVKRVSEALGIDLVPYSRLQPEELKLARAASSDAFHVRTSNYSNVCIVLDDTCGAYYNRSRFSGAHEIGHIVLEHCEDTPDRENEADYFAGYFLVPHPLVINCKPFFNLADVFGVSVDCARFAKDQALARKREGGDWRPHEQWLVDNAIWEGGGLVGII